MSNREPVHAPFAVGTARLEADLGELLGIDPGFVRRMPTIRRRLLALAGRLYNDPLTLVAGATCLVLAVLAIVVMRPPKMPSRRIVDQPVAASPLMRGRPPALAGSRHDRAFRGPPHRAEPIRPPRKNHGFDRAMSVEHAQTRALPDPIVLPAPPAATSLPAAADSPNRPDPVVRGGGDVHLPEVPKTPELDVRRERREGIDAIRALRQR